MTLYVVGDVQGCLSELHALLAQVDFKPQQDQLWLAGDVVARGPQSLETLRFIKSLGDSAKMVLGNHDLHLLAIHAGLTKADPRDFLDQVLAAPDVDELLNWLAQQPLLRQLPEQQAYMSHAGISPQWTLDQAIQLAKIAEQHIRSPNRAQWLAQMYGDAPDHWSDAHSPVAQFRYTVNALTRMRFCHQDLRLELNCKTSVQSAPAHLTPWYQLSDVVKQTPWIFGHWASLMGQCPQANVFALDTGCVWGKHLTLLRWHDKQRFVENCH
jgi:bis(5'-nucleosyl)-tetraphosphatase (symmetrical)